MPSKDKRRKPLTSFSFRISQLLADLTYLRKPPAPNGQERTGDPPGSSCPGPVPLLPLLFPCTGHCAVPAVDGPCPPRDSPAASWPELKAQLGPGAVSPPACWLRDGNQVLERDSCLTAHLKTEKITWPLFHVTCCINHPGKTLESG